MFLFTLFIMQNLKKNVGTDVGTEMLWWCAIFGPEMAQLPWMRFFFGKIIYNFYVLLGLFNGAKFKKKVLRADPELSLFIFFGPKMAHSPLTRIVSKKPLVQFSITSWCLSLRRFWNNLEWIQSYDSIIFELKCPNCPWRSRSMTMLWCIIFGTKMDHLSEDQIPFAWRFAICQTTRPFTWRFFLKKPWIIFSCTSCWGYFREFKCQDIWLMGKKCP